MCFCDDASSDVRECTQRTTWLNTEKFIALECEWPKVTSRDYGEALAKNLFLSRDKQLGRKLQELAITFLLESALSKDRILEIYLNIIEWGPDLRGLRPATILVANPGR